MKGILIKGSLTLKAGLIITSLSILFVALWGCRNPEIKTSPVSVTGVSLEPSTLILEPGDTAQLTITVTPTDAANQEVIWTSGNDTIATVNSTGLVTAVAVGDVTITVATADGSFQDNCEAVVVVPVIGIHLEPSVIFLTPGEIVQLNAAVSPADATNQNVSWTSENDTVVVVDKNGKVSAVSGGTATITVTSDDGLFKDSCEITVTSAYQAFITVWDMSLTTSNTLNIPLNDGGVYDFVIGWGDGTVEVCTGSAAEHTYALANSYTVTINGVCNGFGFSSASEENETNLIDITQWGDVKLHNNGYQFSNCKNLTGFSATDEPDLIGTTNLSCMFYFANVFNQDLSGWDVSGVMDMSGMFGRAFAFNQDISGWDVSNVTNMSSMFSSADAFNQDLSGWDVSNVMNMSWMFSYADAFNQDISGWDVSNVTNMNSLFYASISFNQDISDWDVSSVTNMSFMFNHSTTFNQDISGWDVSNVTDMSYMLSSASAFNQDISDWDVSNVTDMSYMLSSASAFNQDISDWDVSSVTAMSYMFYYAAAFNQDLSEWSTHVAETISHSNFSSGTCPLITENHPWESWDE